MPPENRTVLSERMHDAIVRELLKLQPDGTAQEEIFKGIAEHEALMAIADLLAKLLMDVIDSAGGDFDWDWAKLVDVVAVEARDKFLDEEDR
jgi:hypothetical protein